MVNMISVISVLLKIGKPKNNIEFHWEKEEPPADKEVSSGGNTNLFTDPAESGLLPW